LLSLAFPLLSAGTTLRGATVVVLLIPGLVFESNAFLPVWMPLFLAGILYDLFQSGKIRSPQLLVWLVIFSAFLLYGNPKAFVVIVLALPLIHFLGHVRLPGLHQAGIISYSLYLFHGLSGAVVINVLSHHVSTPVEKIALVGLGVGVALGFAYVTYRIIELPAHRLARTIPMRVG
tara:strand:+ start:200 stop:727 length:528 start_codon:yes stop_codon:yes gene_type:complete